MWRPAWAQQKENKHCLSSYICAKAYIPKSKTEWVSSAHNIIESRISLSSHLWGGDLIMLRLPLLPKCSDSSDNETASVKATMTFKKDYPARDAHNLCLSHQPSIPGCQRDKTGPGKFNSAPDARTERERELSRASTGRHERFTYSRTDGLRVELIILLCANATPNWVW